MFKASLAHWSSKCRPANDPSSVYNATFLCNFGHQLRDIIGAGWWKQWLQTVTNTKCFCLFFLLSNSIILGKVLCVCFFFLNAALVGQSCDDVVVLASSVTASLHPTPPPSPLTYPCPEVISHKHGRRGGRIVNSAEGTVQNGSYC